MDINNAMMSLNYGRVSVDGIDTGLARVRAPTPSVEGVSARLLACWNACRGIPMDQLDARAHDAMVVDMNPLVALIREMIDDEPMSTCAEDGSSCALCGAEWNQARAQFGDGQGMTHTPDCWINRARAALGDLQ